MRGKSAGADRKSGHMLCEGPEVGRSGRSNRGCDCPFRTSAFNGFNLRTGSRPLYTANQAITSKTERLSKLRSLLASPRQSDIVLRQTC